MLIGKKLHQMGRTEAQGLLKVASEQVPLGIYAVQKRGKDYIELRKDKCESRGKLKEMTRQYKTLGWKVYSNG